MKMNALGSASRIALACSLAAIATVSSASAQAGESRTELSVLGGFQALNKNDTALPDHFVNVPAVASVAYNLTSTWAVEGEFTWMIPVTQSVDVGGGLKQDRKNPDVLAYQANVRTNWPLASWTPYLTAGVGAMTFLSNTDADRLPRLDQSQTAFAINFGAGATLPLATHWGLRADYRELAAFPSKDTAGLSSGGSSDAIWMERGTVGLAYRF